MDKIAMEELGKTLFNIGIPEKALKEFKTLSVLDSKVGRYYYYQANCYLVLKDFVEAEKLYTKAIEMDIQPDFLFETYNNRAYVRYAQGNLIGAEEDKIQAKKLKR